MRCLLDKVSARFMVQGLLKLGEGRPPTDKEELALDLFARAPTAPHELFIAPPTLAILQQLMRRLAPSLTSRSNQQVVPQDRRLRTASTVNVTYSVDTPPPPRPGHNHSH